MPDILAALDQPWKVRTEVGLWLAFPVVRTLFALNKVPWGEGWRCYGVPVVQKHRRSRMQFGKGLHLRSSLRSNPLGPQHPVILATWAESAVLEVGDYFAMTGGALCAVNRITIGHHVAIGANTTVVDTDFHPLDWRERRLHPADGRTAPVTIEDDVFIGMNCLILKGVSIGRGSVIGAGAVVTRDIPPGMIAAGNPARVIRSVEERQAPS